MIQVLLLLASIASAQEASTDTLEIPLTTQIEISGLGKDTRSLLSGRYTQTGKPTFKNGFCFSDGTCQTTAAAGSVTTSTGSAYNDTTAGGINLDMAYVNAYSFDGATQSSGCIVAVYFSGADPAGLMRFTSTTTANMDLSGVQVFPGVLTTASCAPGSVCRVGVNGVFRVRGTNASFTAASAQGPNFSSTRCQAVAAASANFTISQAIGRYLTATDASGFFWMKVGL